MNNLPFEPDKLRDYVVSNHAVFKDGSEDAWYFNIIRGGIARFETEHEAMCDIHRTLQQLPGANYGDSVEDLKTLYQREQQRNPFRLLLRKRLYEDNANDLALLDAIKLAIEIEGMNPIYAGPDCGGEPFRYAYRFLEQRLGRSNPVVRHLLDLHLSDMIQD